MTTCKYNLTKTTLGIMMFGVLLFANFNVRAQQPCRADFQWFNECDTFIGMPDCNKLTIYFQDRSYGNPVEWYWNFGDGSTGTGRYADHTYSSPGVYVVCLTIVTKTGCQSRTCKRVIVEKPQNECKADFQWFNECDTFGTPGCNAMTIYFQDRSYGDPVEWYWNFGDGSTGAGRYADHTYDSSGVYEVCLTIVTKTGCQSTTCQKVTVENPQNDCESDFQWFNECDTFGTPGCDAMTIYFQDRSYGDPAVWQWNFGDGTSSTLRNPVHTYDSAGVYEVCLSIVTKTGCQSTTCQKVTVENPRNDCEAAFDVMYTDSATLYLLTDISDEDVVARQWFINGDSISSEQEFYYLFPHEGYYYICLAILTESGCYDLTCDTITITSSTCHADFQWFNECDTFGGMTDCDPLTVYFQDRSSGNPIEWHWTFGDGTNGEGKNVKHTYSYPGTFTICLQIQYEKGCGDFLCKTITVEDPQHECNAYFQWFNECDTFGGIPDCDNKTIYFQDRSSGNPIEWHWIFGDGTNGEGRYVKHTYNYPAKYFVSLEILTDSGCIDVYRKDITVIDTTSCQAHFEYFPLSSGSDSVVGDGYAYTFHDISDDFVMMRFWNFNGDTIIGPSNVVYSFPAPGVYTVCLTIITKSGCTNTYCEDIVVIDTTAGCQAYFRYYEVNQPEYGSDSLYANYLVRFIDMSQGNISEWYWDFGDGSTGYGPDVSYAYNGPGTYYVCLSIVSEYGCQDTWCQWIEVHDNEECDAYFETCNYSLTVDSTVVDSMYIIGFKNMSTGNPDHYLWDFGDGSTSNDENPVHAYAEPGYYEVCLTIWTDDSNCYSVYCDTVDVGMVYCYADFITGFAQPDCEGYWVAYYFEALYNGEVESFSWSFGDGETSNEQNPLHVFENTGFYGICLDIYYTNGCIASECKMIEVSQGIMDSVINSRCQHMSITEQLTNKGIFVGNAYPVPASDKLYLEVYSDSERTISVSLLNILGSTVDMASNYELNAGNNQLILSLDKFETGTYIYIVTSSDQTLRGTISIVK